MKYIRTKDKVIEYEEAIHNIKYWFNNVAHEKDGYNVETETDRLNKSINKQADTIEELCDWFIVEGDDNEITYHRTLFSAEANGKDYILESNEKYTIYGAILVKGKGLIYVAKFNDEKGEFELL